MKKLILILIMLMYLVSSCNNQSSNTKKNRSINKACILLNDSAFVELNKYSFKHENVRHLDTALELLKKAVLCDSAYITAYSNMAITYEYMQNFDAELKTLNKLFIISQEDPWFLIKKGIIFQKIKKIDSAKNMFDLANYSYQARLKDQPENVNLIIDIITLKEISEGKQRAIEELNTQIKRHPKLKNKLLKKTKILKNTSYDHEDL